MKISELVKELESAKEVYGDLTVSCNDYDGERDVEVSGVIISDTSNLVVKIV